jgi:hypothetical protein
MKRSKDEICDEIADMTTEERAAVHRQVQGLQVSDERKKFLHTFIMFLGLAGQIGKQKRPV